MNRLLKLFPNVEWDYYKISMNKYFTMNMLIKHHEKKLAWGHISRWMYLTFKFVKDHPMYKWDYALLSANSSINLNDILKNPDIPWRYDFFSLNVNLPLWYVRDNMEKGWSWYNISRNEGITMTDINKNMDLPWNWMGVSYNVNITIDFLENHPDLPILWSEAVSTNMKVDIDILERHIDKKWDYKRILSGPYLTIDILRYLISKNIMNDRYICTLSIINPAISIQDIENTSDLPWTCSHITNNPNFSLENLNKYILSGKRINLNHIVKNIDAKIDDIYELIINNMDSMIMKLMVHFPMKFGLGTSGLKHFLNQKKMLWDSISANPNITIAFIQKHAKFINFKILSSNNLKLLNRINERSRYFYLLKTINSIPLDISMSLVVNFL